MPSVREATKREVPFTVVPKIFDKVEVETVRKWIAEDSAGGIPDELPAHTCFYLKDKRPLLALKKGKRYFYPAYSTICIIPLADTSVKDFAQAYPYLDYAAMHLRKTLEQRPSKFKFDEDLYDLPFNNAGHAIESREQYLDFKTGTGALFLTQHTRNVAESRQ